MEESICYKHINPADYGITATHKEIIIGNDLFANFFDIIDKLSLGKNYLIITDKNINEAILQSFSHLLSNKNIIILPGNVKAKLSITDLIIRELINYDYAIAIGSGTINDLVKYASYKTNKKYIIFATSPSMNGYLSANSSLINDYNIKQSYQAHSPIAAYFDINIMVNSPVRLIKSGLGDSLCSHTVKADNLLSHYLLNTPYSELPFKIIHTLENTLLDNIDGFNNKDPEIITVLTKILILSGLAMLHTGNSSSASQGEHLIAHLYEILDPKNSHKTFHGEQIAVTCLYMNQLQEMMLTNDTAPQLINQDISMADLKFLPRAIRANIYNNFQQARISSKDTKKINLKLTRIWPDLRSTILANYRSSTYLLKILNKANLPTNIADLKWQKKHFHLASTNAHLIKNRFTFLNLTHTHTVIPHLMRYLVDSK